MWQMYPVTITVYGEYVLSHYLRTYYMVPSLSWEANRFSATQEFPRILWNPKVYYCVDKTAPPFPILSQIKKVHDLHPTS